MRRNLPEEGIVRAIAAGNHGDPFSVLGPHRQGGGWLVSLFLPGCERVSLLSAEGAVAADPYPGVAGFFTATLAGAPDGPPDYRLCASGPGWAAEFDDPYRYPPVLGEIDEYLLGEGSHHRLWQALGGHLISHCGREGAHFALWAPGAQRVSVIGGFNGWEGRRHPMRRRGATGIWEIFIPDLREGEAYKYEILGADGVIGPQRADPLGFGAEIAPGTASLLRLLPAPRLPEGREGRNSPDAPVSIYEVHIGSWRRHADGGMLSYAELADQLVGYAGWMGYTHIELLPVSEHPFEGSWGYQPVGLYAPSARQGTAAEFSALVAAAQKAGLGVILDWVPGHFPADPHGLARFDGTALYEHDNPKEGFHQDWNTLIYNFGRAEVKNFLIANALYWLEVYGADGLRVDAVASMLYRDYSRKPGEWIANKDGGRENYEAIALLQEMNAAVYARSPWIMTAAEESTSFEGVTRPVSQGGLGFGYKWNMGWMNDSLAYMALDPVYRRYHHHRMTFASSYAFTENFILPVSHDEVVHGKGSMIGKMPGDEGQKFANLRAFYGFMWGHPGKKLLFMGQDFGQLREWNHDQGLDWHLEREPLHQGLQRFVRDLNHYYRATPALYRHDCRAEGMKWLLADEADLSVFAWARFGWPGEAPVVILVNMTPVERRLRIGLPAPGLWREALNSDGADYGGANRGNLGEIRAEAVAEGGEEWSAELTLPPLSTIFLEAGPAAEAEE